MCLPAESGDHTQDMATKKTRGRKPQPDSKSGKIRELLKAGQKPAEIAKTVKCSLPLVYNVRSRMSGGASKRKSTPGAKANVVGGNLDELVAAVRRDEAERKRMRGALERIQAVLSDALG